MCLQADFLKMLYDKMTELHMAHADGPEEWRYPLPSFKVTPGPPTLFPSNLSFTC